MKILFSKQAKKDLVKMRGSGSVALKAAKLLDIIKVNPFQNPPPYEKLCGDLEGYYSRRINRQHRLVCRIVGDEIWVVSMWTHYDF